MGAKRRNSSKVHRAVGTLGHLLRQVTATSPHGGALVGSLGAAEQGLIGDHFILAHGDQG